jgi:myosin heavy subunit
MGQLLREGEGVPDFVLMDKLTEDALYANLLTRYKKDQIYTYIGSYSWHSRSRAFLFASV